MNRNDKVCILSWLEEGDAEDNISHESDGNLSEFDGSTEV